MSFLFFNSSCPLLFSQFYWDSSRTAQRKRFPQPNANISEKLISVGWIAFWKWRWSTSQYEFLGILCVWLRELLSLELNRRVEIELAKKQKKNRRPIFIIAFHTDEIWPCAHIWPLWTAMKNTRRRFLSYFFVNSIVSHYSQPNESDFCYQTLIFPKNSYRLVESPSENEDGRPANMNFWKFFVIVFSFWLFPAVVGFWYCFHYSPYNEAKQNWQKITIDIPKHKLFTKKSCLSSQTHWYLFQICW